MHSWVNLGGIRGDSCRNRGARSKLWQDDFCGARDVPARSALTARHAWNIFFNPHVASGQLRAGTSRAPVHWRARAIPMRAGRIHRGIGRYSMANPLPCLPGPLSLDSVPHSSVPATHGFASRAVYSSFQVPITSPIGFSPACPQEGSPASREAPPAVSARVDGHPLRLAQEFSFQSTNTLEIHPSKVKHDESSESASFVLASGSDCGKVGY